MSVNLVIDVVQVLDDSHSANIMDANIMVKTEQIGQTRMDDRQLIIPDILIEATELSEENETILTKQFAINTSEKLTKLYPSNKLTENQLACLYSTISSGIINLSKNLSDNVSNETSIKMSASARKIIEQNNQMKLKKEMDDIINQIKNNEDDIVNKDRPTIISLEGIVQYYTSIIANKIIKLIVLRSLIRRYVNTGENELISLIFEFKNELLEFANEWNITETIVEIDNDVNKQSGRKNHRKERMTKLLVTNAVEKFDYPTVLELSSNELSRRIKFAIKRTVEEANDIIQKNNIDSVRYQMVDSYWRLKPLSSWDKSIHKLDGWQLNAIEMINNNKSIIIIAPTSSGKTVIAQQCAVKDLKSGRKSKVLFVVPNNVLALQVAGTFCNSGIATGLFTNEDEYGDINNATVIVATPSKAEEIFCIASLQLTYAVFDEIQQINGFEGEAIERLIKIIDCPFLILSATVNHPEIFCEYISNVTNKEVELLQYNKRFIVQQKHIWNSTDLITLHPLNCIDVDYIVEKRFASGDLAMTARDVYIMGCDMAEFFADYNVNWCLHPNLYFNTNGAITISMVELYEKHLKDKLIQLAIVDPDKVAEYLQKYAIDQSTVWTANETETIQRIIDMFKTLKNRQLLPALCFMMNPIVVLDVYKKIISVLEDTETHYFPWYHNFMNNLHKTVKSFSENENTMRESISKSINGRGNKMKQIQDQMNHKKREFIVNFLGDIRDKYDYEIQKTENNNSLTIDEKNMIIKFLNADYLHKYNIHFTNQKNAIEVRLPQFNPDAPTSLFSFHKTALSIETMRNVKNSLKKFIRQTVSTTMSKDISYDNLFIRGIERGIVLYSSSMPAPFQRVIQELIISNQAPVCISDDSLAYGVNFPTRTVVILGNTPNEIIDVSKGTQMSGRSGRRGYDTQGHIVYCRVDYKNIMRGSYVPFVGKDTMTPFTLLPGKIFGNPQYVVNVLKCPLKTFMNDTLAIHNYDVQQFLTEYAEIYNGDENFKQDGIMSMLLWHFRDEPNIAYNIFTLVSKLLHFVKYASICIKTKNKNANKHNSKFSHNQKNDDDDDDDDDTNDKDKDGNKIIYQMKQVHINQLVELLFRVFDNDDSTINDTIDNDSENSDNESLQSNDILGEIIYSDAWDVPLNMSNTYIIKCIHNHSANRYKNDSGIISDIIKRTHHVILCALKLYNLFVDIGNKNMVAVLNPVINELKAFNDKLKIIDN